MAFGAALAQTVAVAYPWYLEINDAAKRYETLLTEARGSGCTLVHYYESPAVEYKLGFGQISGAGLHNSALAKLYPNYVTYQVWERNFQNFSGIISPEETLRFFKHQKCVYLLGSDISRFHELGFGISPKILSLVDRTYPPAGVFTAIYHLNISPDTTWNDIMTAPK